MCGVPSGNWRPFAGVRWAIQRRKPCMKAPAAHSQAAAIEPLLQIFACRYVSQIWSDKQCARILATSPVSSLCYPSTVQYLPLVARMAVSTASILGNPISSEAKGKITRYSVSSQLPMPTPTCSCILAVADVSAASAALFDQMCPA